MPGLGCGVFDCARPRLWRTESVVAALKLLVGARGI